jgi:arginyl-tRNA synthetase
VTLSEEDRKRAHIEVSGRKGQGVKADDLLDTLEAEATKEVRQRNQGLTPTETEQSRGKSPSERCATFY